MALLEGSMGIGWYQGGTRPTPDHPGKGVTGVFVFARLMNRPGSTDWPGLTATQSEYASIPTQEQTRLRSPNTLSMRPTAGQNLWSWSHLAGKQACSRGEGGFQS